MKKLSILLVFAVVFVFSIPALAQNPFADVPADHWAYDAVTQAVAGGIIQGFPDGTYKGAQNLTRYEVAMIIARILDNIEQERKILLREIETVDAGLSTSVEDMEAMVEADIQLLAEKLNVEVETVKRAVTADVDVLRADLTSYIDALEARLGTKIVGVESSLGAKVDAVDAKVAGVADGVDAVDAKVDDVDAKVESFMDLLSDVDFWIDVLFDKVDYVDARVDDVSADMASFDAELGDVAAEVADVDSKVAQVVADVTAVDSKVVNVAAEVRDMGNLLSQLQASMDAIEDAVLDDMDLYMDYLLDLEFWVDILFDEMDYVNSRLEEVADKVAAVDSKVDTLVAELDRKIQRVAADVKAVEAEVAGLAADVEDKLAALAADMDAKLAAFDALEDQAKEAAAKAEEAAAKAAAVDARVDALAADMDAGFDKVAGDVAAVDARIDDLAADVEKKLEGISAELVDEVAADVAAVDARVDGLAADMDARMREMAAGLDAVDIKVDILGDKVDEVDAKVDALDARTADIGIQLGEMEKEILERIAKTQQELSAAQATQVVAIVERMLERHEPDVTKEEVVEMIEGLNALIDEFADELSVVLEGMEKEIAALRFVPAQVVDLEKKAAELDERLAILEDPFLKFSAATAVNFNATRVAGDPVVLTDRHVVRYPAGTLPAADVDYTDPATGEQYVIVSTPSDVFYNDLVGKSRVRRTDTFNQTLNMDLHFERDVVEVDFNISGRADYANIDTDLIGIDIDTLEGVITTPDMTATIKDGQGVDFKDYLLDGAKLDGVVVEAGDHVYTLAKYEIAGVDEKLVKFEIGTTKYDLYNAWRLVVEYFDTTTNNVVTATEFYEAEASDWEAAAQAVAGNNNIVLNYTVTGGAVIDTPATADARGDVYAAKHSDLNLMNRDFNLYYALGGVDVGDTAVVALDHSFELAGFGIAADFGLSTEVGDFGLDGRLIRFQGKREIAEIRLTVDLELTDNFNSILGSHRATKQGFGVLAEREISLFDTYAKFSIFDYGATSENIFGFGLALDSGKLTLAGADITSSFDFKTETVAGNTKIEFKAAGNRYLGPVDTTVSFLYLDDEFEGDEKLELKVVGIHDTLYPGLKATATLVLIEDFSLTLEGVYEALPITAGLKLALPDADITLWGRYTQPEFAHYAGVDLGVDGGFKYSGAGLNLDAGVEGRKALAENLDLVGSVNVARFEDADLPGTRLKRALGLTYAVSADADANVTYEIVNIGHDGGDYQYRVLKAGVSLSF